MVVGPGAPEKCELESRTDYLYAHAGRFPASIVFPGDHVGYTLGMELFRTAMRTERHPHNNDGSALTESLRADGDGDEGGGGNMETTGRVSGWVDCELLVAGSYLHAHRVVLARRSPVLRDMIAEVTKDIKCRTEEANATLLLPVVLCTKYRRIQHRQY